MGHHPSRQRRRDRSLNAARAYRPAIGQRIFIHTSARRPIKADDELLAGYFRQRDLTLPPMSALPLGGIVGSAVVANIVTRPAPFRPLKGALGLFRVGGDEFQCRVARQGAALVE